MSVLTGLFVILVLQIKGYIIHIQIWQRVHDIDIGVKLRLGHRERLLNVHFLQVARHLLLDLLLNLV